MFLEDKDSAALDSAIKQLKLKAKDTDSETCRFKMHDCGHEDGKPCKNEVNL